MDFLFSSYHIDIPSNFHYYIWVLLLLIFLAMAAIIFIETSKTEHYKGLYKKAEKEVRKHREIYNNYKIDLRLLGALMDQINFPIWQRDNDMRIVFCNVKYCETVNETRENILRKGDINLFTNSVDIAKKALRTNKPQYFEQNIFIQGKANLNQIVEIPFDSINDKHGNLGTVGFAIDLNDLQNARDKLRQQTDLQKKILENTNDAVAIFGPNQRLEYFNAIFAELWKLDEDWLRNYPSFSHILDKLQEKRRLPEQANFVKFKKDSLEMFQNLISTKEDYYYFTDGTVLKVIAIPYHQNGILLLYRDLTNQINLERKYETLLHAQKSTLEHLEEAIIVFGEDKRVKLYNPIYINMWGLSDAMLDSEPHLNDILNEEKGLFSTNDWQNYEDNFLTVINERKFSETKIKRTDDVILTQRIIPLADGDILVIYTDITDTENVERSLIAERIAYEQADAIKTNFLSNVSYELRSPLTSIMGFSEILMMSEENTKTKTYSYLKAIFDSSISLKSLIDNIIDISTIDAGYMNLDKKKTRTDDIYNDLKRNLEDRIQNYAHNIRLDMSYSRQLDYFEADRTRLMQMLNVLADNIINITENNKKETTIGISFKKENRNLNIELWNDNSSIKENDLHHMYDKFVKLETSSIKGSGLDLYLAKRIIDLHQGFIDIDIVNDKLTYTINIPLM